MRSLSKRGWSRRSRPALREPLVLGVLALLLAAPARAQSPEEVVARFCERDGYGHRLDASTWQGIGALVRWSVEPAWDRVVLISGYEIRPARKEGDDVVVPVRYTVVAEVNAWGVVELTRNQTVELRLEGGAAGWALSGPPHAPHVFENNVDREEMAQSLAPETPGYVSSSKLVFQMFRGAGWSVSYVPAAAFLSTEAYVPVTAPRFGDVVAYLQGGEPYHVGIYRGEGRVVSATITGGPLRSNLNAFPGEIRYLRLRRPSAEQGSTPEPEESPAPAAGEEPVANG